MEETAMKAVCAMICSKKQETMNMGIGRAQHAGVTLSVLQRAAGELKITCNKK